MNKRILAVFLAVVMCLASFASYAGGYYTYNSVGNRIWVNTGSSGSGGGGGAGGGTVKFVPKNGVIDGLAGPGATVSKSIYAETVNTRTVDGSWSKADDGKWQFKMNGKAVYSGWYLIKNTTANENQWYYFENEKMVTGWKWIKCADGLYRCYYFNPNADASHGACALNCQTPDKYTVNGSGAWTVEGVEVTKQTL